MEKSIIGREKEKARLSDQLLNFSYALEDFFHESSIPKSWTEAFRLLSVNLEKMGNGSKIVFIDELPWLDTPKSQFLSALEHFWNDWAYYRNDIKLIVCGSATSWMLKKLINARGGLHNRVTHKMLISPFCLEEVEQYFQNYGFNYERPEIIDCYMAVGGVAYYLSLFEKNKSVAENIDTLCFTRGGELTYLHFMKDKGDYGKNYWLQKIGSPEYTSWSGYAFEIVCLHHINQIVNALGISGSYYSPCTWSYRPSEAVKNDSDADVDLKTGGQIDLLIDRKDKTISICEMKYSEGEYEITKSYADRVEQRLRTFRKVTSTKKSFSKVYVTPFGLVDNMYARKVTKQITADDFFKNTLTH